MSGTVAGGKKAAQKNLERDPDFYKKIGKRGGEYSTGGGFAAMTPEQRSAAGRKGGSASRRRVDGSKAVKVAQKPREHKSWLQRVFGKGQTN